MSQNVWNLKGATKERQKRRAQVVKMSLDKKIINKILDIGCAEGYATSFIADESRLVVGVELDFEYLKIAKNKLRQVLFINASIDHLPFRDSLFDAVCILEVLEHLSSNLQRSGLKEADRVLRSKGPLIISVPYKEQIVYTRCIHCENMTPLYGHLHSLDEYKILSLLPSHFRLVKKFHLPNVTMISSSSMLRTLPILIWLVINNTLGLLTKGYWIVLQFTKIP
jgi:ubiquinone/menaquinone biosynthesis C-methylase UbiE